MFLLEWKSEPVDDAKSRSVFFRDVLETDLPRISKSSPTPLNESVSKTNLHNDQFPPYIQVRMTTVFSIVTSSFYHVRPSTYDRNMLLICLRMNARSPRNLPANSHFHWNGDSTLQKLHESSSELSIRFRTVSFQSST